ncbi:MAG: tetratricopeptide repeat protein [Gallionellaceae bacterium]|nr:tetratricopeptide repeat protein [Gallionellaceae bacterium]
MVTSRFSRVLPVALLLAWLPAASVAHAAAPNVQDANQAFRQGNNPAALEKVNAFLAANPKDAQGRFLKGLILTELNRYNDAVKVFADLTEDYPELPEPYNNLAVLYAAQAQYDRAKNSLEMAIRTHPSYATAHENLGDIYAKMASQSYDKALQLDKSNTSALTKLAMIRDLFSPTHVVDAGKSKAPAKTGTTKTSQLTQATTAPTEQVRPAAPAKVEEAAKPQVVPAAASKPAETAAVAIDPNVEIERTVHAWADVWSQRDAEGYLAFYSKNFQVPGGSDRAEWETERKARVTRPEFIKVELDRIKIKLQGDSAKVSFTQRYTSNTYKDKGMKTLVLEKQGDAWKIVEER